MQHSHSWGGGGGGRGRHSPVYSGLCVSSFTGGLLTGSYALWNVYAMIVLAVHVQGAGGEGGGDVM